MQPKVVPMRREIRPKMAGKAYDAVAHKWDAMYVDKRAEAENRWLFSWMKREGYFAGDVLEVACGTGMLLDYVKLDPARYLGSDLSDGMLATARNKHPMHQFRQMDMGDLKLEDAKYDVVLCLFCGFSYVEDTAKAALELRRVLKPGGKLLVMPYGQRTQETDAYPIFLEGRRVERYFHPVSSLRLIFDKFSDVRVRGFSFTLDRLPKWLPQWAFNLWASWEMRHPRQGGYFNIVTGRK